MREHVEKERKRGSEPDIVRKLGGGEGGHSPEQTAKSDMREIADKYRKQIADALAKLTVSA